MRGYLNNEKATKEIIDQDGWLHTGDIGFFDEDGFVFLVGRLKELIKVQGFQVSPSELEDLLRRIPGVGDCAVIGVDVANKGEAPRAYIVKSDASLTEEKIHAFVKEKAARYKQLAGGIEFVTSIPKNATGKILRRALKAMYDDAHK
jgi:acyl-CoA synthetase (AMP-forming)/AMP-acid ligase II